MQKESRTRQDVYVLGELKDFYMAVRVDLLEIMGFQQTFEGGEGMEFFSFKRQPVECPQSESIPEIFKKQKESTVILTESLQRNMPKR